MRKIAVITLAIFFAASTAVVWNVYEANNPIFDTESNVLALRQIFSKNKVQNLDLHDLNIEMCTLQLSYVSEDNTCGDGRSLKQVYHIFDLSTFRQVETRLYENHGNSSISLVGNTGTSSIGFFEIVPVIPFEEQLKQAVLNANASTGSIHEYCSQHTATSTGLILRLTATIGSEGRASKILENEARRCVKH